VDGRFGYALSGELERDRLLHVAELVYRDLGS
jgi:anti-sigma factor RsiW